MRLNIEEDGLISIQLEPDDKQVVVNIGGAEVQYGKPRAGNWYVDVRIVPAAGEEQEG
jgi:hypothetical protein